MCKCVIQKKVSRSELLTSTLLMKALCYCFCHDLYVLHNSFPVNSRNISFPHLPSHHKTVGITHLTVGVLGLSCMLLCPVFNLGFREGTRDYSASSFACLNPLASPDISFFANVFLVFKINIYIFK